MIKTIMPKILRELALVIAGVALGSGLLYLSSLVTYDPSGCGGCDASGIPQFWTINATGSGGPLVNWFAVANDLVFWFAISLTAVELSFHVAVPYVKRGVMIHRAKRRSVSTS